MSPRARSVIGGNPVKRPAAGQGAASPWCSRATRSIRICRCSRTSLSRYGSKSCPTTRSTPACSRRPRCCSSKRGCSSGPGTLSGGQRQRVAIGRAIVRQPKIFLFDEPLSNLDAALRSEMRIELMELHKRLGSTMIYVTHDQVEAMTMADKIVVLNAGRIEQVGSPLELYHKPHNLFVAGFIGSPKMNFVKAVVSSVSNGEVVVDLRGNGRMTLKRAGADADLVGKEVTLGIRPEHLTLGSGVFTVSATPNIIERLGIHTIACCTLPSGENFTCLFDGDPDISEGAAFTVGLDPADCHLFDTEGRAIARGEAVDYSRFRTESSGGVPGEDQCSTLSGFCRARARTFARSEQQLARVILTDIAGALRASIVELATAADVSAPTVTRFCRRVGCDSFSEFKVRLAQSRSVVQR